MVVVNDVVVSVVFGIVLLCIVVEEYFVLVDGYFDVCVCVYWFGEECIFFGVGLFVLVYFYGGGFMIVGIDWVFWDV